MVFFIIFNSMKVVITIADDLCNKLMKYTNSTTASEAVNLAVKDWMVFQKIREMNKRVVENSYNFNLNKKTPVRETKNLSFR